MTKRMGSDTTELFSAAAGLTARSQNSEPILNDSGISLSGETSTEVDKLKEELREERRKVTNLEAREMTLKQEVVDLRSKLENAIRGRPSSGDLSSATVLDMLERQLEGMSIVNSVKLENLIGHKCLCEDIEALGKEAEDGDIRLVELVSDI